jgi:hypothetical protein
MVRKLFPKTIVFKTSTEAVTLRLTIDGHFVVERGEDPKPKVKWESTYEIIAASFKTEDMSKLPPGPLKVTARFWWGYKTVDPRVEKLTLKMS